MDTREHSHSVSTCLQGLLRELLALCPEPGERHNTVLRALAAALSGRNMHEDAGMALAAAGELAGALEAYRAGGQWRMALVLAGAQLHWHLCNVEIFTLQVELKSCTIRFILNV